LSDFTEVADLGVTIAGQLLDGRLYHLRLLFSGSNTPMGCYRLIIAKSGIISHAGDQPLGTASSYRVSLT
jgi:hypothetical protein